MSRLVKLLELNQEMESAILQCEEKKVAQNLIAFLKTKNEKYSYQECNGKYYINSFYPSFPGKAWNRIINGISRIANKNERVPIVADIVVTGKCHCNCWHCFRARHNAIDLSFGKIRECIEELHEMGTATIGITGGEPMLRSDIMEIISLIPDDMEGQLYTTGRGIDDVVASFLSQTNITRCIISLDHYDKEVVCQLRHNEDAYEDAVNAIKSLIGANMYVTVTVCMTEELADEENFEKYVQFANQLGVSEIRVVMQIPQGNLEGNNVGRIYGNTLSMVKKLKDKYNKQEDFATILNFCEIESSSYFGCNAGANYLSINNDGNVTPCVAVPLTFGNVYEKSIREIYQNMELYFPCSARVCYGIASSRIIKNEEIDTSVVPISIEKSEYVAEKCVMATGRGNLFDFCKTDR